jgi:hypothetical protein
MSQLMQFQYECALVAASRGYILGVHMNKHIMLNNVMPDLDKISTLNTWSCAKSIPR